MRVKTEIRQGLDQIWKFLNCFLRQINWKIDHKFCFQIPRNLLSARRFPTVNRMNVLVKTIT